MSAPRVLVTRPLPQGERTADKLRTLGYEPLLAPMLRIEPTCPAGGYDFSGVQAILVTSANAITHFAALTHSREIPVLAVGDRTAAIARDLGFEAVTSAKGDGIALLNLARGLQQDQGLILHPSGTDTAVSFDALNDEGFNFRAMIVYDAVQMAALPEEVELQLPSAVLVYSTRTAKAFAGALSRSELIDPASLTIIGISEAALDPLENLGCARLVAAKSPDEAAIFEMLQATMPISA